MGEGFKPFIGLSNKMRNKKIIMFFAHPRQSFILIWILEWFKAALETFSWGGGHTCQKKKKLTNQ